MTLVKEVVMLQNKKILLGVTGGIAAYKAVDLASRLIKSGAQVKVIMTQNACEFVQPLTFRSITHESVVTKAFDADAEIRHISLADWADLIIIAPATANIIGKIAGGIADDLLSTVVMASTAAKLIVPAMNVHMYENPIVQNNISKLAELGYRFMEPEVGVLACGYKGKGRFPVPAEIVYFIKSILEYKPLKEKLNVLITAGSCKEKIDPMRFISNYSSGKMGLALARAAHIRGCDVTLIMGNTTEEIPKYLKVIRAESAEDFHRETIRISKQYDMIIMAAAISDYRPSIISKEKIKKSNELTLNLERTRDVLCELGQGKPENQILVGFAAESQDLVKNAKAKLEKKNLDFIVANSLNVAGKEDTEALIITKEDILSLSGTKFKVANEIISEIWKIKQ